MHRAMKRGCGSPARLVFDGFMSAPVGQDAIFVLLQCIGGGANIGNLQVESSPSTPIESPQVVHPSGADPQPAHPSSAWVATAQLEGTCGDGGLLGPILTCPNAGELKCLGPLHRTASNEITPAHASIVDAHSTGTGLGTTIPFRSYQRSDDWCSAAERAW